MKVDPPPGHNIGNIIATKHINIIIYNKYILQSNQVFLRLYLLIS